ncbi:uncharacterized protein K441DRAFT_651620 [Cenococcum geophilum 1.58]|uniref:uncharacterized protein n=1 Tax=Cenococcum geophilum 1.58 TaxID=794803 RepID=UPI00358FC1FD|nr:hypothetical protein K441DRAFT_651620 [Cenococcum geophilum 1.58]
MPTPNSLDHIAIQNTLARYCIALDDKDFAALSDVFVADCDAHYPIPGGDLKGVTAVQNAIQARLKPVTSQHALTTQTITISEDGMTASAVTYFTGVHFGTGVKEGQSVTAYGKYLDELVRSETQSEQWRIKRRECKFMGRVGESGVMDPQ